jgi:hypothetical protein
MTCGFILPVIMKYGDCEYVEVCESKEQKGIRQVVEGVNSQIKLFNRVSR